MNRQDFEIRTKIIRKTFNDERKIKYPTPENEKMIDGIIYDEGDIFTTENGELIDLELLLDDFTELELAKYVRLAEKLYEKTQKHVSIYIICPDGSNVHVKEREIPSEADFTIKLACINEDPAEIILKIVWEKVTNGQMLDEDDIFAIAMLPLLYSNRT